MNRKAEERYKQFGRPYIREKLDFGDYSAFCLLPSGEKIDLSNKVTIERKMSIDELCQCFTIGRARFEREFQRATDSNAKVYLLIENCSWRKIFLHQYMSKMTVASLVGSLLTFVNRYNLIPIFCESGYSGQLIAEILKYEMKEELAKIE